MGETYLLNFLWGMDIVKDMFQIKNVMIENMKEKLQD